MMDYPVLYTFRRCPYAMRARMALKYANISYIHREVKLSERPKELYKISSKGTVPVLHISNSEIIDESIEIMHYALNKRDIDNWYIFNKPLQNKLIEKNDGPFKKALDRYKYHVRFKEDSYESYQDEVSKLLNEYDIMLDDQNFLINDHISLADIAIFPFVRQCAHVDLIWFEAKFKNLYTWLENFKGSSLFLSIMGKYQFWKPEDKQTIINND